MKFRHVKLLSNPSEEIGIKLSLIFVLSLLLCLLNASGCNIMDSKEAAGASKDSEIFRPVTVEEFESLRKKIKVLEDKDAIISLLSRYSLNVDLGRAESFLGLFTDDCVFATDVAGKIFYRRGKKELGEMLSAGPPPKGQHLQLNYNISVNGDTATAVGYQDLTSLKGNALTLSRAAFRYLKFRCIAGNWLIQEVYTIGIDNEAEYSKILPADI